MSVRFIVFFVAAAAASFTGASASFASPHGVGHSGPDSARKYGEEQAELLHRAGNPQPVTIDRRADLRGLMQDTAERAARLRLGCEPQDLFELRLSRGILRVIGGYSVYVTCEDGPSPGLTYYFDVDGGYLGAVAAVH